MEIAEVVNLMRNSPISLFYGAGVSIDCGGPNWNQLTDVVKEKFPDKTETDFFQLMQSIIGYNDDHRKEVESIISKRLASISPTERQKYLFSIPWKAIMTTNYDRLPELVGVSLDGSRQIVSVSDPNAEVNQEKEELLYCFKLLGDYQYSYPQGGWMVLSNSDLISDSERRTNFFKQFRTLAVSGHIIYLGYSFNDDLVFLLLSHMRKVLHNYSWTGYAIMPHEPTETVAKKLTSVGITWVKGDLEIFVNETKKVFGDKPKSAPVDVGTMVIHGQAIDIDRSLLSNIKNKFMLLNEEMMSQNSEKIEDFLSGNSKTYFPYVWHWDFDRNTTIAWLNPDSIRLIPKDLSTFSARATITDFNKNLFCALVGIAGSGKTVFAKRIAFNWHQTGNPVLFVNPKDPSIDTKALDGLMNEIRDKYLKKTKSAGIENPRPIKWLIIADDSGPIVGQIKVLWEHLMASGKPADIFMVARESESPIDKLKLYEPDAIYRLNDTIFEHDVDNFLNHFKRFGVIDEEIFNHNIRDKDVNTSFFALIYSTLHCSRKSIKKLLKEEYDKLDGESKKIYQAVSLIQAYQLEPLVSLITKSQDINPEVLKPRYEKGNLSGILRAANNQRSLFTLQRVIAEAISDAVFRTSDERRQALSTMINSVTYGEESEMRFLESLLNFRIEIDVGPKVSLDHKIDLYNRAIRVVKSKPLLIHLGRLQTNNHKFSEARKTLREAHDAFVSGFDERAEHVKDAEGRLENAIAEDEIVNGHRDLAWAHLEEAERKFTEAKINPRITPHPYTGVARTYLTKAKLITEKNLQLNFILTAAQECNYLEKSLGETPESYIIKQEITNLLSLAHFDELQIEQMSDLIGKANGYAYLAEIRYSGDHLPDALRLVDKGLSFDPLSIWLMRLKVSILRRQSPGNHNIIRNTIDDYAAIAPEKFDIQLAFELSKETYADGNVREAKIKFRELTRKAENHPSLLTHREPEDRWYNGANPQRLSGTITKLPTTDLHGKIKTTFPQIYEDLLVVRKQDLQYDNPRVGDRVSYEIIFNMLGPEASRVRKIS
ncbi:MAG: SIR2 family protein [Candidatus Bathyarchaeota archaeon]|nr:SIR2 family protein [Candidatus Bathyarchaeota archaeon]